MDAYVLVLALIALDRFLLYASFWCGGRMKVRGRL